MKEYLKILFRRQLEVEARIDALAKIRDFSSEESAACKKLRLEALHDERDFLDSAIDFFISQFMSK